MVKNSYIHHSTDSQNWKSRADNTIFAFNWVDEDYAYSMGADSNNGLNTLWLGNVAVKRTYPGINQGRLLGVGDGTGVAKGIVVALNNTFVTSMPRDFYLFTEKSSTGGRVPGEQRLCWAGAVVSGQEWAGEGRRREQLGGQRGGRSAGDACRDAARGRAGFVDAAGFDYRLKAASPLIDAGVSKEEYVRLVKLVTDNAREGEGGKASQEWLEALEDIEQPTPAFSPERKAPGVAPRAVEGRDRYRRVRVCEVTRSITEGRWMKGGLV